MDMPINTFKQRLKSGKAQIGLWLGLATPTARSWQPMPTLIGY